ncbi:MAG: cytochrome c [Gammaproteobacteria bacterium]
MRRVSKVAVMLALAGATGTVFAAGDASAGKAKFATCAGCHGPAGVSSNPMWPNLAGQKEGYVIKQLKDFRAGNRTNPLMSPMAKPLSDSDIENLAAYVSSLPCK